MKRLRNRKGFTLIELIIVILILGILMLMVIPRIRETTAQARETVCGSNKHSLVSIAYVYARECYEKGLPLPETTAAYELENEENVLRRAFVSNPARCPGGGAYTIVWRPEIHVLCDEHDAE